MRLRHFHADRAAANDQDFRARRADRKSFRLSKRRIRQTLNLRHVGA